MLFIVFLYQTT